MVEATGENLSRSGPDGAGALARATGAVAALTLVSRLFGLGRDAIIAGYFGAGSATDAFFVAFRVPNLFRRLVSEGSLAPALVPVLTEELQDSPSAGRKAFRALLGWMLLVSAAAAVVGICVAGPLTDVLAPGFQGDPEQRLLAVSLTRILFPYLILATLLALCSSTLNAIGYFAIPAGAPALFNAAIILCVVLFSAGNPEPIYVLAASVLVGGAVAVCLPASALLREGFPLVPSAPWRSDAVRRARRLAGPAVIGASTYQLLVFLNTVFASFLDEGSIGWLYYADRLFQFPLGVFSLALGAAVLPELARAAAVNDTPEFNERVARALSWITYLTVPAAFALAVLAGPVVAAVYERGSFSSLDTRESAAALAAFALGLSALSWHAILVRAYLAKKAGVLPALAALLTLAVDALLALALMGEPLEPPTGRVTSLLYEAREQLALTSLGHVGLALAASIASWTNFLVLYALLPLIGVRLSLPAFLDSFLRAFAASAVMALIVWRLTLLEDDALYFVLVCVPAGILVYAAASVLLRSREALEIVSFLKQRFGSPGD